MPITTEMVKVYTIVGHYGDEEWLASEIVYCDELIALRQLERLVNRPGRGAGVHYEVREMVLDNVRHATTT